MKKFLSLMILFVILAPLTSCVSDGNLKKIEGYWKGKNESGETVIYFGEDKKGTAYLTSENMSFYINFEYEITKDTVTMIMSDETNEIEYSIKDGVLTFDGSKMTKASEADVPKNAENLSDYIAPEGNAVIGYWEGSVNSQKAGMLFENGGTGRIYYFIDGGVYYAEADWEINGDEIAIAFLGNVSKSKFKVENGTLTVGEASLKKKPDSDIPQNAKDISEYAENTSH